ncbi:MAG: serine hydrolase domain-containing protein [Gammaproteobacteria bacterium]
MNKLFVVPVLALLAAACVSTDVQSEDGASFLRPSTYNADQELLGRLTTELDALEFHAVLIVKDGGLVYEKYFSRTDEEWGTDLGEVSFEANTLHDLRSASKSVVSALVGIAIEEEFIRGLNTPVTELLNEETLRAYEPPAENSPLLLKHLLSMSAGFDWNERIPYTSPKNPEIQMWESDHPAQFALSRPFADEPGARFNYNGGLTQILVAILEQNTGVALDEYAASRLFAPLGISNVEWIRHKSGQPWGASGLRLNVRDFAKFGQLYLQNGKWQGRQLVPADWVAASVASHIDTGFPIKMYYGLHWLLPGYESAGESLAAWMVQGNGGQTLILFPEHELMVVTMAGYYNDVVNMVMLPPKISRQYILPAFGIADVSQPRTTTGTTNSR